MISAPETRIIIKSNSCQDSNSRGSTAAPVYKPSVSIGLRAVLARAVLAPRKKNRQPFSDLLLRAKKTTPPPPSVSRVNVVHINSLLVVSAGTDVGLFFPSPNIIAPFLWAELLLTVLFAVRF